MGDVDRTHMHTGRVRGMEPQRTLVQRAMARSCLRGQHEAVPEWGQEAAQGVYWSELRKHKVTAYTAGGKWTMISAVDSEIHLQRGTKEKLRCTEGWTGGRRQICTSAHSSAHRREVLSCHCERPFQCHISQDDALRCACFFPASVGHSQSKHGVWQHMPSVQATQL